MITHSDKYEEITNGGGGHGFSEKEILVEFMKEQKKVNQFVVEKLLEGENKIGKNTSAVYYMKWIVGFILPALVYTFLSTL